MLFDRFYPAISVLIVAASSMLPTSAAETSTREGVAQPLKTVIISASLRELITSIAVEEGERIEKDQVLVSLEAKKEKLAVERLKQLIAKAEFDYNASKRLFEKSVSSRDEMLSRQVELKRLQTELEIAKAEVAEREILAPFTGVVVYRFHEPGEAVNEAEPILKVIAEDQLLMLFYLEAEMLSVLKEGDEVELEFPAVSQKEKRTGTINFIDPEVDARSGLFRVRVLMDNQDHSVRPGMKVLGEFPSLK